MATDTVPAPKATDETRPAPPSARSSHVRRLPKNHRYGVTNSGEARVDFHHLAGHDQVVVIPGAGHLTMIDAPEQTNATIRAFLERVEIEAGMR